MGGRRGRWSGGAWSRSALLGGIAWSAVVLWSCGPEVVPTASPRATLLPITTSLLGHQAPFEARLVDGEKPVELELTGGHLPQGLELVDGRIRGIPHQAGEHRRFEITLWDAESSYHERRVYSLSIGFNGSLTRLVTGAEADGDLVHVVRNFGRTINEAFLFDPALNLAWPMRGGGTADGSALASPTGELRLFARGSAWQGGYSVLGGKWDARTGVVWQLVWESEKPVDFDLHLIPHASTGLAAVHADTPVLEHDGHWLARHAIDSGEQPRGVEAIVTSTDLAPGNYALVAVRVGGESHVADLWLAARTRAGDVVAEDRFIAFVSDVSSGSFEQDRKERRQSWRALGHLAVSDGGAVTWEPPVRGELFPPDLGR